MPYAEGIVKCPVLGLLLLAHLAAPSEPQVGLLRPLPEVVIYEENLRAEGSDTAFNAVTDRLDSIQALGANVLWLMPIQPVGKLKSAGGLGSPYACADFDAVNPEFGTPADLHRLIAAAHQRKIAVILDWVANHTAWDNPWIQQHPDWYRHDKDGHIIIPPGTNWRDVAALDFKNAEMKAAMIASMKGWVKNYDIDGFRCDSADFPPFEFWKDAVPRLRAASSKPLLMLAEGTRPDQYDAGFDLTYGWDFAAKVREAFKGASASGVAAAASREASATPSGKGRLRFVINHDESAWNGTLQDFFKTEEGIKSAFVVTALSVGTPLIYSGQEVAWPKRIPIFDRSKVDWTSNPRMERWTADLIRLRQKHPAFESPSIAYLPADDAIVFVRQGASERILVVANIRDRSINIALPSPLPGMWTDLETGEKVGVGATLALPAFRYRILSQ